MTTATKSNSQAAAAVLGELGALVTENGQKLHGATFDDAPHDDGDEVREMSDSSGASLGDKIAELLDQIDQGFQADDASNLEKLTIARKYGPMLLELKEIAPHGTFKLRLKERFPKISYAKCNRWMFLASQETEVAAAIEKYPDVAWGPKKMVDFLKGSWTPEPKDEDDWLEEDEEESDGFVKDDYFDSDDEPADVVTLDSGMAEAEEPPQSQTPTSHAVPPGATAGPVVQAVRTPAQNGRAKKGKKPNASANNAEKKGSSRPAIKMKEYEVDARIGFKLSVPETITLEEVERAVREVKNWNFGLMTPFENDISEGGVVVNHVRSWDSLDGFEPEAIPE